MEEKVYIIEKLRPISKKEGRIELFQTGQHAQFLDYFSERVR
jgi:hypothetical protein